MVFRRNTQAVQPSVQAVDRCRVSSLLDLKMLSAWRCLASFASSFRKLRFWSDNTTPLAKVAVQTLNFGQTLRLHGHARGFPSPRE